jgi:hypothetical protein
MGTVTKLRDPYPILCNNDHNNDLSVTSKTFTLRSLRMKDAKRYFMFVVSAYFCTALAGVHCKSQFLVFFGVSKRLHALRL